MSHKTQIIAPILGCGVGDAVCSQISPEIYREFSLGLHQELFRYIHEKGGLVEVHICGDITHILPDLAKENIDILDADWMVDMRYAHEVMGPEMMICGNLDPVSVFLNGDAPSSVRNLKRAGTPFPWRIGF